MRLPKWIRGSGLVIAFGLVVIGVMVGSSVADAAEDALAWLKGDDHHAHDDLDDDPPDSAFLDEEPDADGYLP